MQRFTFILTLVTLAALTAAPAPAQWSTAKLYQPRGNVAGVTVGDLALFAGGNVGPTYFDDVDIYDAALGAPSDPGAWSTAKLTQARTELGATVVGDLALFAGGGGASGTSNVIDVFDAQSKTWSTATPLTAPRTQIAATTVGQKALFAGGFRPGFGVQDTVDIYDASKGAPSNPAAWSTATLSLARAQATAVTVGSLAIFAGGYGFQGVPYDTVDIYDDSSGTWSTATPLSVARLMGADAAAVVGTRAYFGGGHFSFQGGPNMSDAVDIYDASIGAPSNPAAWSTATLSLARGYVGVTAVGNTVLFAGGAGTGFVHSDVVDRLNVGTGQWDATSVLSQARRPSAVTVGARAMFAAGATTGGAGGGSDVVDIYEPVGLNYCVAATNSTGCAASISATGSMSLAANDLTLSSVCVPDGFFLFFHGASQAQAPFGNGYLCAGGGLVRIPPPSIASGGLAQKTVDLPSAGITSPGARNFQCWFRDSAAGGANFNLSDALEITFVP